MKPNIFILILVAFLLVGCQSEPANTEQDHLSIVTSTTMLGDLVANIGQDRVDVTTLFGPGIDPHLALPTGSDTRNLQQADLIVFNGLHLEVHFYQILAAYENKTLEVGEQLNSNQLIYYEEDGQQTADPHYWFSVPLWIEAAKIIGQQLMDIDPQQADFYKENLESYIEQLEQLHDWIIDQVQQLDEDQRVLVTAHDAFGYFAREYGFEQAAIGGMSTESEVTTRDVNDVATIIVEKQVPAIFIESTVPQTSVDAVIAEVQRRVFNVTIGNELYSDALGTGEMAQYLQAFKYNVESIVHALSK